MVYNVLNKLKWTKQLKDCEIIIIHRGAENDQKNISGGNITEVKKGYFLYKDEKTQEETHIPMHRILEVRINEKCLWKRKL